MKAKKPNTSVDAEAFPLVVLPGDGREAHYTPPWPVKLLSEALALPAGDWLECMAGEGHLIRGINLARTNGALDEQSDVTWTAVEKHRACAPFLKPLVAELVIGDALEVLAKWGREGRRWRVGITNPAFSLALPATQLLLGLCEWVVILQKSLWPGDAEDRLDAFLKNVPDEYRIGRVDFDGRGGDRYTYSWFVWGPWERGRRFGRICLLRRPTPEERALKFDRRTGALVAAPKQRDLGLLLDVPEVQQSEAERTHVAAEGIAR